MRRPSRLLLLALIALPALAGAPPRVAIPEGTRLRIFDIGPKDAWYGQRAGLSDLQCTVGPGPLKPVASNWFRGKMHCDDGRDYTFLRVTFEALSTLGPTAEGCPIGSWVGGNLPEGTRASILGISPGDGYFGSADLIGRTGTVTYGEMYPSRGAKSCWFGGTLVLDDPSGYYGEYYFYEVALSVEAMGTGVAAYGGEGGYYPTYEEPACPVDAFTGSTLPHGARVAIADVHPEDAYYDGRYEYIGRTGSVDGDLHNNSGTCWMGGGMIGDDGTSYYFYKTAVTVLDGTGTTGGPTCAEGVATAATIPKGNRIKIVDIHPEDAYYASRFTVIGQTGTATEQLELMDGCWYSGPLRSDDGQDWYFFKASVVDLGTPQ